MLRLVSTILLVSVLSFANTELKYTLIKKTDGVTKKDDNNTLLVIGGIQGDEPGGFLAASLLSTQYKITKGALWVVPNLNFPSIIKRSRGISGDMNRKFSKISKKDPDYDTVSKIKTLITDPKVALIVNLHDGSGFYREKYIDKYQNPKRWGNSCIIDQNDLNNSKYGNLHEIASMVVEGINKHLQEDKHKYHVKNTKTRLGDQEMLKSLTFFAIENGKSAFANEASKFLRTHERVYYHLLALENYMHIMGIEFTRDFELKPESIRKVINEGLEVSLFDKKIYLSLDNPRSVIKYVPLPKKKAIDYKASNPLTAIVKDGKTYSIHYGNRKLTKLVPEYFDYTEDIENVTVDIDGQETTVPLGSLIKANEYIKVLPIKNQRVNVIGYRNSKHKNEVNLKIQKSNVSRQYSIDKNGKTFRVEIYDTSKDKKGTYAGMFLVEFAFGAKLNKKEQMASIKSRSNKVN